MHGLSWVVQTVKGISPLVATVLLIAFTVAVGGLLSVWLTGFSTQTTDIIKQQSNTQLTCSYGGISVDTLKYSSAAGSLAGNVRNTGLIGLGNFTLQVVWQNATIFSTQLCTNTTSAYSCSISNMSLTASQLAAFNVTVGGGGNYQTIRVSTNCTNAFDTASSS